MDLDQLLFDLLFLEPAKKPPKAAPPVRAVVDREAHREEAIKLKEEVIKEVVALDLNYCYLPLAIFAVCASLTALLLIFLRKMDCSETEIECNFSTQPIQDIGVSATKATWEDKMQSHLPSQLSLPPASIPEEQVRFFEESSVFPACEEESTITFRNYVDLKEEEMSVPKFWCHYQCPSPQSLSNHEVQDAGPDYNDHQQQLDKRQLQQQQLQQYQLPLQQQQQQQQHQQQQLLEHQLPLQQQQQQLQQQQEQQQQQQQGKMMHYPQQMQSCDGAMSQPSRLDSHPIGPKQPGDYQGSTKLFQPQADGDRTEVKQQEGVPHGSCTGGVNLQKEVLASTLATEKNDNQQILKDDCAVNMYKTNSKGIKRHSLANKHCDLGVKIMKTSPAKQGLSTTQHAGKVTIDNFSEVMCLDAATTLNEDSDSHNIQSSTSREDSYGSYETQQSSCEMHATRNIELNGYSLLGKENSFQVINIPSFKRETVTSTEIPNKMGGILRKSKGSTIKNTKRSGNLMALETSFKRQTSPSKINEMNKLANAISRASITASRKAPSGRNSPKVRKNGPQLRKMLSRSLDDVDGWCHRILQLPVISHCGNSDHSDSNEFFNDNVPHCFKRKVSGSSQHRVRMTNPQSPRITVPIGFLHSPNTSRRLVVTDQVYDNRGRSPERLLQAQKLARCRYVRHKGPLSLNNSQTKETRHPRSRLFKRAHSHPFTSTQFAFPKPQPRKLSGFKDKTFNFGKNNARHQWQSLKPTKTNLRDENNETLKLGPGYFGTLLKSKPELAFPCLIPQGAALVELMGKGLNDIKKFYKHGMQLKRPGGGVTRVSRNSRYCPYPNYKQDRGSNADLNVVGQRNHFSRLDSFVNRDTCPVGYGFSTDDFFSRPQSKSCSLNKDKKWIDPRCEEKKLNFKSCDNQLEDNANIPLSSDQNFERRDTQNAHRLEKRRNECPKFKCRPLEHASHSERLRTHKPEHGHVFLFDSPIFNKTEKCNINAKNKLMSSLQNLHYESRQEEHHVNQQAHVHDTRYIQAAYTAHPCREPASRADSDTSRSRLLPMRPEIKSTDISSRTKQLADPRRMLLGHDEEQETPGESLSTSASRTRQTAEHFEWSRFSDSESDGLFQVSSGEETDIKNTSFKSESPWSTSSFWNHSPKQSKGPNTMNIVQSREALTPLHVNRKPYSNLAHASAINEARLAKSSLDQDPLNTSSNKSSRMSQGSQGISLNNMGATQVCPSKNKTYIGESSDFGEKKNTMNKWDMSYLKLEEDSDDSKKKSEGSTIIEKAEATSMPQVCTQPMHDTETDSANTPSIGFVSRIVDAHRHKLYSHKTFKRNPQVDSQALHNMLVKNTGDDFFQSKPGNKQKHEDHGPSKYGKSGLNSPSSFINNLSDGRACLSLVGELTLVSDSIPPPSSPPFVQNHQDITEFETEPEKDHSRTRGSIKGPGVQLTLQLDQASTNNSKTKATQSNATSYLESLFPSRGSPSPNSTKIRLSIKTNESCMLAVSQGSQANTELTRKISSSFQNNSSHTHTPHSTTETARELKEIEGNRESTGSRLYSKSSLKTHSPNTEQPPLARRSPETRRSSRTILSSENLNYASNFSSDSDNSLLKRRSESLHFSPMNKIAPSSLASQRKTGQTQISAKYQRFLSMNKSRMNSVFCQRKITPADALQTDRTSIPENMRKSKSRANLKRLRARKIESTETSTDSPQPQLSKQSDWTASKNIDVKTATLLQDAQFTEKGTCSSTKKIEEQPRGNANVETVNNVKGLTLPKAAEGKCGQSDDPKNTDNEITCNDISLRTKTDVKNKFRTVVNKPQEKLKIQNVKAAAHHNITGYHTNERINRRKLQKKTQSLNAHNSIPTKDNEKKSATITRFQPPQHDRETTQSQIKSLETQTNQSQTDRGSKKPWNLKTQQQVNTFQQNGNKQEKDQCAAVTSKNSIVSLSGLFHISLSDGRGSWFQGSPTDLSPHRNGTYIKSGSSSAQNYARSKRHSLGYTSDVSHTESFASGSLFAACNSNSEQNTLKNVSRKLKETGTGERNTRASFLAEANSKKEPTGFSYNQGFGEANPSSFNRNFSETDKPFWNRSRNKQQSPSKVPKDEKGSVSSLKQRTHIPANTNSIVSSKNSQVARQRFNSSKSENIPALVAQGSRENKDGRQSSYKTNRMRVPSGRSHTTGRALSTNNSAAVFPKNILRYWGRMKISEKAMLLRLPVNLFSQSIHKSDKSQALVPGLRGEGDGGGAGDTLTSNASNLQVIIPQHLNRRTAQCESSPSFDWYKPAARIHRRRTQLRRCYRQSQQSNTENIYLSGKTVCNSHATPSSILSEETLTVAMFPITTQDGCNESKTADKQLEGSVFGDNEISNISDIKQSPDTSDFLDTSTCTSIGHSFTARVSAKKSLSCSNIPEASGQKTTYLTLGSQRPRLHRYMTIETNMSPPLATENGVELSLLFISPDCESKSSQRSPANPENEAKIASSKEGKCI